VRGRGNAGADSAICLANRLSCISAIFALLTRAAGGASGWERAGVHRQRQITIEVLHLANGNVLTENLRKHFSFVFAAIRTLEIGVFDNRHASAAIASERLAAKRSQKISEGADCATEESSSVRPAGTRILVLRQFGRARLTSVRRDERSPCG